MSDFDDEGKNPYGGAVAVKSETGSVVAEASRAATEVQAQVVMARRFPRDPMKACDAILQECDIPDLAKVALYSYPRGGTQVEGPSIRLAEVLKRHWGNMMSGTIEVERAGDTSSMLTYAWDLETNVMSRKEFKVKHVRDSKSGGKQAVTEERDIYEVAANAAARRERACILALIPGHVVNAAVARCKHTVSTKIGDVHEAAARMVEAFQGLGVSQVQVEKRLHHRLEAISAAEIVALGNVFNSIKDGYAGVEDYFEIEAVDEQKHSTTAEKARAAAARAAGRPAAAEPEETHGQAPANAAAAPQAQQQAASDEVLGARQIVERYIDKAVRPKDRENFKGLLAHMGTKEKIEAFYSSLIEQYGDPTLFSEGGEQ